MTAGELLNASGGLREIGEYSIPSPKASYALTRIKRAANTELQDIETTRVTLCETHAEKDDGGAPKTTEGGKYVGLDGNDLFAAAWRAVLDENVTLAGCRALTLDELEGATKVIRFPDDPKRVEVIRGIPSDVLFALGPIVTDPSPPDAAS